MAVIDDLAPFVYYKLDEASGSFIDSSANGNDLTVTGTVTYERPPIVNVPGAFSVGTAVVRNTPSTGFVVDGTVTVQGALRVNSYPTGNSPRFLHIGDTTLSTNRGMSFFISETGEIGVNGWASSAFRTVRTTGAPIAENSEALIHIVLTPTVFEVWVDGELFESVVHAFTYNNNTTTPPVYVGSQKSTAAQDFWEGDIGHIAVFNQRLTQADIEAVSFEFEQFTPNYEAPAEVVELSGTGSYRVPPGKKISNALVIAGGGGGGSNQGGGGGAGGLIYETDLADDYTTTRAYSVGNGGNGGPFSSRGNGTNGQNTTFGALTAIGGGFGSGSTGVAGGDGGSGGGGDGALPPYPLGGSATAGQGNIGGSKATGTPGEGAGFPGGGGAGAGGGLYGNTAEQAAVAAVSSLEVNTIGGDGLYYGDIFGDDKGDSGWFASGGSGLGGNGIIGGGGSGADSPDNALLNGAPGQAGTGGGGGCGGPTYRAGGAGGTGTILLLVESLEAPPSGGGGGPYEGVTVVPYVPVPAVPPTLETDIPTTGTVVGGEIVDLAPVFSGDTPITYRWYRNSKLIRTSSNPDLSITTGPDDNGATYYCQATNGAGTLSTGTFTLTVTSPSFTAFSTDLPVTTNVTAYTDPVLRVKASSPRGVSYQWYLVGVGALPDTDSETFPLGRINTDSDGIQFYVEATDAYGTTITSTTTTLAVISTSLDDQTTPGAVIDDPKQPFTRTQTNSWASMVAAADGGKPFFYGEYEFSGRTFYKRDQLLNPKV